MLGSPKPHHEQILRFPEYHTLQSSLRMCTSQELPREQPRYPHPAPQTKQKISIKQFINRRNMQAQSCVSLSQASERPPQEDLRTLPQDSRKNPCSFLRSPQKVANVQNNNAFNYIFGECVIKPQQVRIIYHNSPPQKIEDPSSPNQHKFNSAQPQKLFPTPNPPTASTTSTPMQNSVPTPPVAVIVSPTINLNKEEKEAANKKQETFNQFMSFGPKHFDLFKNMEALKINQITSHIVEETERTELDAQSHASKKRLTKTFSEMKFRKQREQFATVSQLEGRTPFARSNLFRSIKKTETMGGKDESSDHESEVVEKFESLMQKVRQNRLDNSIIDI